MPEQINSGSGTAYPWIINPEGAGLVSGAFGISLGSNVQFTGSVAITTNPVPISGAITVNNIIGSIVIGSVSASVDSLYIQSGAPLFGYSDSEFIRINSGSPASWKAFSNTYDSFSIENLGSAAIYYSLNSAVNEAGSSYASLLGGEGESIDIRVGSVSIQSSGTSSSLIQMKGIWFA